MWHCYYFWLVKGGHTCISLSLPHPFFLSLSADKLMSDVTEITAMNMVWATGTSEKLTVSCFFYTTNMIQSWSDEGQLFCCNVIKDATLQPFIDQDFFIKWSCLAEAGALETWNICGKQNMFTGSDKTLCPCFLLKVMLPLFIIFAEGDKVT